MPHQAARRPAVRQRSVQQRSVQHRATLLIAFLGLSAILVALMGPGTGSAAPDPQSEPDALLGAASVVRAASASDETSDDGSDALPDGMTERREAEPDRTVIEDAEGGWVATFTDGASTATVTGASRDFDEPTADHGVTTETWVRVLPEPFEGEVDGDWLVDALADTSPDVLAIAMEYTTGAPDVVDDDGVLVSTEAGYGPLQPDGDRPIGADWHDFQGVDGVYGDHIDLPDEQEYRHLDCSGYVRVVFGVRKGMQMTLWPEDGDGIPRRSRHQASDAPGVAPIPNVGSRVDGSEFDRLQPGDLVFFDAPSDGDDTIDHVGIYLGVDRGGQHRFVHSRRSANGPTMGGDGNGPSVLDGDGFFAEGFRSTRRL